jgi:parallel beta-helix repeat protein
VGYGNVISGNAEEGVYIASTAEATSIAGNTIGLTFDGDLPVGNGKDGVFVDGAAGTTITANLVSGNAGDGIGVEGAGAVGTEISGNIVGLNAAGDAALGNQGVGIAVVDVPSIRIGGGSSIERNVVSGNESHGIVVTSTLAEGAANSRISSNYVGLDASGTAAIGNAGDGIRIEGVGAVSATIVSNVVAANAGAGIRVTGDASSAVISANTIGLDAAASAAPDPDFGNKEDGVRLEGGSGHLVGGDAIDANVVAQNFGNGIVASATDAATIAANIVGTNLAGASGLGNSGDGIVVDNAVGTTIRLNLSSGNGGSGVSVSGDGSSATAIVGNFIGTSIGGITALPNSQHGVSVSEAAGTTIGGATTADRNVISGNIQKGVSIASATSTEVVGNYVGVTSNGYSALGNAGGGIAVELATDTTILGGNIVAFNGSDADGHGITISRSAGTVVGSEAAGLSGGNAIYRNRGDGVRIADGSMGTIVVGNAIGTTSAGVYGLGNEGAGIAVIESNGSVLGGLRAVSATDPVLGNLIVGNGGSGIAMSDATPLNPDVEDGNHVQGNTIRWNGGAGVLLTRSSLQTIGGSSTRQANEIIQNSGDGVAIDNSGGGAGGHVVSGNAIGTDVSGSLRLGNAGDGISIRESVANTISGGNVIAYNRSGVVLVGVSPASSDEGNVVAGNTISSNVGDGVRLEASTLNTIGAIGELPGNSVVFNGGAGVSLAGGSSGNLVAGNLIGTDAGNAVKSNAKQGVLITASEQNEVLGNTIAWNRLGGVRVVGGGGNVIGGIDADANAIRSNGGAGVVLAGGTVGNSVGGNMVRGNAAGGIAVSASRDNRIEGGNVVVKNQKFGISVSGGAGNSIDANFVGTNVAQTAQLGNLGPGIMVNGGTGMRVGVTSANVVRFNGGDGIQFTNVSAATADDASAVSSNFISSNTGAGISVTGGALVAITDNIVGGSSAGAGNGRSGIVVGGNAADVGVTGNSVLGNAVHGIELVSAIGTMVGGGDEAANTIEGNRSDGIYVAGGSRGVVIGGNTISANRGDGIEINASIGNRVEGATITSNGAAGVAVVSAKASSTADGNVISGATIDSNVVGVSILGSSGTSVIDGNTISRSAAAGILVGAKSSQTVIESNTITESRGAGVEVNASRSTAVRDNQVTSGGAAGVLLTQASGTSAIDGNTIEGNEIEGNATSGITLVGSSFNALGGNIVHGNRGHGIALRQASNANSLLANAVGYDATGVVNGNGGDGIRISGSFSNVIGQGNDVAGNAGAGVSVLDSFAATSATGNRIEATTIADNGGAGVVLNGGAHVVGGTAGLGNTITGNAGHGVAISAPSGVAKIAGATVAGNTIQSNGGSGISLTGAAGTVLSGNSIGDHAAAGIALVGGTGNRIVSNVIGGDFGANVAGVSLSAGAAQNVVIGNTVSANEGDGIAITGARSTDNLIGVRSVGTGEAGLANKVFANLGAGIRVTQGIRNQVAGNSIYKNVGGGIVLQDGGNSSQSSPTLTSARRVVVAGRPQLQVTGEVRGAPRQRIVVDLYRNDITDGNPATGLGYQARAAIGRVTVTLDATGRGTFTTTLSANVPAGDRITAVATTASGVVGNSSQQSAVAIFA